MTAPAAERWTIATLLGRARAFLEEKGVDSPRLTAEVLLADALSCDRVRLYTEFDKPLGETELAAFRERVRRRAGGEPTHYIVGVRHFLGRAFRVDRRALVPRPETESLVAEVLAELPKDAPTSGGAPMRVLELGVGTGCIAITIALERPNARVFAIDVSEDALALAAENAAALAAPVELARADLFDGAPAGPWDAIVSNPPYVATAEIDRLMREVRDHEPRLALDGGPDGLDVIRRIAAQAASHLAPSGLLALEVGDDQASGVADLMTRAGFTSVSVRRDLARTPRIVLARR